MLYVFSVFICFYHTCCLKMSKEMYITDKSNSDDDDDGDNKNDSNKENDNSNEDDD